MSSSAVPHVVAFLTRPLLKSFPLAAVSTAQLILSASLASLLSATFTLNAAAPLPAPLLAASLGAGIPWEKWLAALGSSEILLFFGPGYVKARLGNAAVTDIWSEETQGSVVPISRVQAQPKAASLIQQNNTGARLRAMLLSARVRSARRQQAAVIAQPIRIPSLPFSPTSDSDSSSSSDSESDYCDSESDTASSASSYTPIDSPVKSTPAALPAVGPYRPPFARMRARAPAAAPTASTPTTKPRTAAAPHPIPATNPSKKDTTAYVYQGGVTRVMTGGVMLGARHVPRATRS
ncbi:hypothetical protein R3P38DRAFT_3250208 [Favolaschia claudopus]|uniref:Uncharacterized protein n=1 Tax=Favolaschia claudopus TaxID=2862362 RepID=A0AAW0EH92_9AGAR